jgi:peptidoglycan/xylan/chitin deacetylase (PgdA/CDA1 family)
VINLTLHGVGVPCRPLEPYEEHVWLAEHTLGVILDVLLKFRDFTLTVDDANQSDVRIVLPALLTRKLTAIFFIPAGRLGQQGYLRQEDIQTLVAEGMEVGTHGMYHRDWRELDDGELSVEINNSKKNLEEITGQEIRKVSCPYGSYDRRVLHYLRNTHFQKVYTSDRGRAQSKWWIQPRNSLHTTDNPQTLATIMAQPNSTSESLIRSIKRIVKRWR